jgi:hypothetical protein
MPGPNKSTNEDAQKAAEGYVLVKPVIITISCNREIRKIVRHKERKNLLHGDPIFLMQIKISSKEIMKIFIDIMEVIIWRRTSCYPYKIFGIYSYNS